MQLILHIWQDDDIMTWKWFLHYWFFCAGIRWSPVDSPHKGPVTWTFDVTSHDKTGINSWQLRIMTGNHTTQGTLQWRYNECNGDSNHQPHECLLNYLFRRRSKKTSKLRITGLCDGNSPVTSEFLTQRVSNVEDVSIWWRHHNMVKMEFDSLLHWHHMVGDLGQHWFR